MKKSLFSFVAASFFSFNALANDTTDLGAYDDSAMAGEDAYLDGATDAEEDQMTLQKIIELTNKLRKARGQKPLKPRSDLMKTSSVHASWMAAVDKLKHYPYNPKLRHLNIGENIAWGHRSAESVVKGWRNSPKHYENLLRGRYQHIGVARVGKYWVQQFD